MNRFGARYAQRKTSISAMEVRKLGVCKIDRFGSFFGALAGRDIGKETIRMPFFDLTAIRRFERTPICIGR